MKFVISACEPAREYTDTGLLPSARLVFQHTVSGTKQGCALHARASLKGPLAFLWAKIIGGGFRDSIQADLDRLVRLVEVP